ncbi:MAG: Rab family GTPase [Planctomycetota bacterium]
MIRRKVCMLGAFAVGKTSLVERFVHSIFSEDYLTTVGVRIEKKELSVDGVEVVLVIWDLHGDDDFQQVRSSYVRGSSGFVLIADGTRARTVEAALTLRDRMSEDLGDVPSVFLLNKSDLADEWELDDAALERLRAEGLSPRLTSAKTGEGVEDAFHELAARMMAPK